MTARPACPTAQAKLGKFDATGTPVEAMPVAAPAEVNGMAERVAVVSVAYRRICRARYGSQGRLAPILSTPSACEASYVSNCSY
jgi:hypothetical protein